MNSTTKTKQQFIFHVGEKYYSERLIPIAEVVFITGWSRAQIYVKMQEGAFPKPKKIGERAVRWKLSDIHQWMSELPDVC